MTPPEFEEWLLNELSAASYAESQAKSLIGSDGVWYWRGWQQALKAVLDKISEKENSFTDGLD